MIKSVVCSQNYSPYLHHTKLPPNPNKINLYQNTNNHSQKQWKFHANAAKGFSGSTPMKETATTKKTSNNKRNKKDEDEDEEIPQVVFDRMISRILISVGVPMAAGFASLYVFGFLKAQQLWDVPASVQFLTIFVTFGTSTLR